VICVKHLSDKRVDYAGPNINTTQGRGGHHFTKQRIKKWLKNMRTWVSDARGQK